VTVAERWRTVRDEVDAIARAVGRDPADVTVVAVSKLQPADAVREAAAAGVTDVAENYAQELVAKQDEVALPALRWHFIGRLQRNKARMVVGRAALIHAVDSLELAQEIGKRAVGAAQRGPDGSLYGAGGRQDVLVAVNTGGEEQKSGVAPDEVGALVEAIGAVANVRVQGLMTMPPLPDDPEQSRPYFRALRELRDRLGLRHLSMGTSGDYRVAIEEGATLVRIGTAIFGARP
jgi:pyridoxal phosphate enzyme (YggS family)